MKTWILRTCIVLIFALLGFLASFVVAPDVGTAAVVGFERSFSGLEEKQLVLPTGESMVYLEGGDPSGETLLLLHGFGANKDNFTRLARKLGRYHLIIPDLVGFGESSKPQGGNYRSGWQAYRLRLLLKQMQITKAHIAGSSMGGHIALAFAYRYPKATQSLYLLAPGGFWSAAKTPVFANITDKNNPLIIKTVDDYRRIYQLSMSKPPYVPDAMLGSFAKPSIANHKLEAVIFAQIQDDSIEQRAAVVGKSELPVRVVWGGEDNLLSADTARLAATLMPKAQVDVWQGVGHLPMLEDVDGVAQDYMAFLHGLPADR